MTSTDTYKQACLGKFTSILKWDELEPFWQAVRDAEQQWYIYETEGEPPTEPVSYEALCAFISRADRLLREHHEHDYCGIVYCDNTDRPTMVKIYDPDNLGVVCGYSDNPPLPKWILSHLQPTSLDQPRKRQPLWRKWLPDF